MRLSIAIAATLFSSAPAVAADATTFKGTIGKIPVILEMADAADSGTFVARYAYMSKDVDIPLHGRIDLNDGLTMEEEAPCTDKTCKNAAGELLDRVVDLVRLLDLIGAERLVRLRPVPLAAAPQVSHQLERIFKSGLVLHGSGRISRLRGSAVRPRLPVS